MTRFTGTSLGMMVLLIAGAWIGPRPAFAQNGQFASAPTIMHPNRALESEPLPAQILAVADYSAQMRVMQHCNRLVMTRGNIARTFVADARIAEVVQFRPNELVLIGLETGRTTVTLWFEDSPEPLIYLVEIVHGPVSAPRAVSQNSGREEEAQVTAYANRRKPESRSGASRQRPTISVKSVAADTGLPSVNPSLRREPAIMPSRGRYDGHAPWPAANRKSPPGAAPIGFDGILAGHVKTPR